MRLQVIVRKDTLGGVTAKAAAKLRSGMYKAMGASVMRIAGDATVVPPMPYKTGTLRRSVTFAVRGSWPSLVGVVGTNVKYARIQEQGGTSGKNGKSVVRPHWFMKRAVDSNRQYVREQFRKFALLG